MSRRILIVDYGVGNLYSVRRAVEMAGGEDVVLSADPRALASADAVILPGVGAFSDGMQGLRERGLIEPIVAYAQAGKPLLGICLGMQMLASVSEEFGTHEGLNVIPGEVKAIPRTSSQGQALKVPFIGWTAVTVDNPATLVGSCLEAHPAHAALYLVHSFHVVPGDPAHLLASYGFGGHRITAAIRSGNVTGCQFHPEKSGEAGLAIMRTFIGQT